MPVSGTAMERVIRVGKVMSSKIGAPKNSKSKNVRLLSVQIGPQLKTVQLVPPAGEDFSPVNGSTVVLLESGGWIYAIGSADDVDPDSNLSAGEKEIRSTNGSGGLGVRLRMKANGKAYLANAGQNLRDALDSLETALDTLTNATAQAALVSGAASSATLAAAINVLFVTFNASLATAKTALDALLDNSA